MILGEVVVVMIMIIIIISAPAREATEVPGVERRCARTRSARRTACANTGTACAKTGGKARSATCPCATKSTRSATRSTGSARIQTFARATKDITDRRAINGASEASLNF